MMIPLLSALIRCASADACPSDEELLAAIKNRDNDTAGKVALALYAEEPDGFFSVHAVRVQGISHVHCDERCDTTSNSIKCTFRVQYPRSTVLEVAQLSRQGDEWVIEDSMSVTLKRKGR